MRPLNLFQSGSKNILAVYHDDIGADEVFSQSVALARMNGARLTLIDVIPERYWTPAGVEERRRRLARLLPAVAADGVADARVEVIRGTPFLEIIRQVLRYKHDLVVASPAAPTGLRSLYLGSTATHLIRKSPCPVWIVKPNRACRYERILACVDPKSDQHGQNELDRKIVEIAAALANDNEAKLLVAHAWDVEGPDLDRLRSEIQDTAREAILANHGTLHRTRVQSLLDQCASVGPERHVLLPRGEPHSTIVDLVGEHEVDLIVMGSVNRTGIAGFLVGNVAETIMNSVRCGVFAIKPEGFRSPVVLEERIAAQ